MNYFGLTDVGKVRKQNQDFFLCCNPEKDNWALLLVCDGMGGAKAGNIASELACRVFSEIFTASVSDGLEPQEIGALMLEALSVANSSVYKMSLSDYECRGMGTTLVAAYIKDRTCVLLNVGDSRAYIAENGRIRQVTHDHSYVQRLIDAGELSEDDAKHYENRNVITRAVGTMPTVKGDLYNPFLIDGSRIILATDGLTNIVDPEELLSVSLSQDAEMSCRTLVDLALERGASDNVTVVICDI